MKFNISPAHTHTQKDAQSENCLKSFFYAKISRVMCFSRDGVFSVVLTPLTITSFLLLDIPATSLVTELLSG